jgi:hypothetical protein
VEEFLEMKHATSELLEALISMQSAQGCIPGTETGLLSLFVNELAGN